ncbi:MAG: molybdopterin molybdenumtransferase MoeA [Anaerolineales bacterium]|nr:molybdopterin molybdenumtransferase MoeA [Anaerolineales bacterium]
MYSELLSVGQALDRILKYVVPLSTEKVPLSHALDRVLAEELRTLHDLPPFDNSAMDGFAVRSEDTEGASEESPATFVVIGDISAGEVPSEVIQPGQAMRIMTGAVLPQGADAVVPVEETSVKDAMVGKELPNQVLIEVQTGSGANVRRAGQDVTEGSLILKAGHRLRPQDIGMLAASGISHPLVHRKPRVALLSTGDELVEVDKQLEPGQIRDSNGYALEAAIRAAGGIPIRLGIASDTAEDVKEFLERGIQEGADLIVTSAGVSMGAYDFLRSVVQTHGKLDFWRVNIRPGKPLIMGVFRKIPLLGLPGNPVSALVTFEIFVKPVISKMSGMDEIERMWLKARLFHSISSDTRESYLRAQITWKEGEYWARLTGSQDSGVLSSLVKANALIIIPAGVEYLPEGDQVEAWILTHGSVTSGDEGQ